MSISCINKADNFKWVLTNVYGPNKPTERDDFWMELDNASRLWDLPWCLGGDFNVILKCDEKKGCTKITKSMRDFANFIYTHDLIDLPMKVSRYTWSNGQSNLVMSRLDRFLLSPSFEAHYPFASQLAKDEPTSDHIPLLLDISDSSWGSSPFRFEVMWFLENGFIKLLEDWWQSFCFAGTASTVLWLKLKALKEKLQIWNKEVFGITNSKLNLILEEIQDIYGYAEDNILTENMVNEKIKLKKNLKKLLR
ncbi:uncharacterized protein LOC113316149 [Papaver somniferum]|uniref:uncharacterized protein LOC113316149 n=1 Tax=Papaver somniferum TaxID=3469 RepID=UPI000E6F6C8D|nr:uncharacterized protein LOC113316149 [Papaver somniferum]